MHATLFKSLFSYINLANEGSVKLGDHTTLRIRGIENVPLSLHDGVPRILQNVWWVPNLRRNLISESTLEDLGCQINTSEGIREVLKYE